MLGPVEAHLSGPGLGGYSSPREFMAARRTSPRPNPCSVLLPHPSCNRMARGGAESPREQLAAFTGGLEPLSKGAGLQSQTPARVKLCQTLRHCEKAKLVT